MKMKLVPGQIAWARSPVRLDLGGGWTDTPPYTNLYGGSVVNVAVNLNGQMPVQVFVRRTTDEYISLKSIDLDCEERVSRLEVLQDYCNPTSPFGLAKASLCQVLSEYDPARYTLPQILKDIGGGLSVTTFVAVPKGSGLGTSSVLGATLLGALHESFGITFGQKQNKFLEKVLFLEKMLTTGGGWQDQVGGAIGGVKFTQNQPGENIALDVEFLDDSIFGLSKSASLFVLYYTGHTRLAKNILSQVVARVQARDTEYLQLHQELARQAESMRKAISRRDLASVGRLLALYWQLKKRIHPSAANPETEDLFEAVRPMVNAACLMGAGGGGYAFFLAKDQEQAGALRQFLANANFAESARLVDWSLSRQGLQVSLS